MRAPLHTKIFRLLCLALHMVKGVALASTVLPIVSPHRRAHLASRWAFQLLDILSVRLSIQRCGQTPAGSAGVYVANHISWIDIVALQAIAPAQFVAKSEIRDWPIIGWLARQTDTLFIRRHKRRDLLRVIEAMRSALRAGNRIVVFPEGTTTDGTHLKPFHAGLLQAAISADAWVCPVAIRYPSSDGSVNSVAAYTEEISLGRSLWQIVSQTSLQVELTFAEPIFARDRCRRDLAQHAAARIAAALRRSRTHSARRSAQTPCTSQTLLEFAE